MSVIGVKSITGITSITNAAGGADVLTFHSNNTTERVRIKSDGKVGIGTVTPNALLDVYSSTAATDKDLLIVRSITGAFAVRCSDITASNPTWALRTYANEDIIFSPGAIEKLRIESGGNIGIGTDNPNNLLHVYGGIIKSQSNPTNTGTDVELIRAQSGSGGGAVFTIRAENAADDNSNWDIKTNANEALTFTIGSATERLRIASNGNVSIGNNPTVHADTLFHVEKSGETNVKFEGDTTTLGARLQLQNNNTAAGALNQIDFNDAGGQSTSSIKGFNTDQTNNYGELAFFTRSAQGSPPAERLRIDSDGKILMGVAANNGPAAPLHIYGSSNTTPILAFTRSSTHDDWQGGGIGLVDEGGTYKGALTFYTHGSSGTKNDSVTERVRIDSAGTVLISEHDNYNNTAIVQLQDNIIGGIRVAVNDETISAAINMPRKGGILCLTCFSTYDTYVQPQPSGLVYVDVGPSKRVDVLDVGSVVASGIVGKTTYTSNVGDCDNGKLTVMVGQTDGTIHLVNRYHDWAGVWTITFL